MKNTRILTILGFLALHLNFNCKKSKPILIEGSRQITLKIQIRVEDPNHISPDGFAYFHLIKRKHLPPYSVSSVVDRNNYSQRILLGDDQYFEVNDTIHVIRSGNNNSHTDTTEQFFCIVTNKSLPTGAAWTNVPDSFNIIQAELFSFTNLFYLHKSIEINPYETTKIYGTFR